VKTAHVLVVGCLAIGFIWWTQGGVKSETKTSSSSFVPVDEDPKEVEMRKAALLKSKSSGEDRSVAAIPKKAPVYNFGEDRAGQRIATLLNLTDELKSNTSESTKKHMDFLNALRKDPNGYNDVLEIIERIQGDPKYQIEAAGLLEVLAEDPAHKQVAHHIAERQMNAVIPDGVALPGEAQSEEELNQSLSTTPDMIPAVVAQEVFVKTAMNEQEAFDGTLKVIMRQPNHNVRTAMIVAFSNIYPDRRSELEQTLKSRGIQLVE
jgi:hypothetical protein